MPSPYVEATVIIIIRVEDMEVLARLASIWGCRGRILGLSSRRTPGIQKSTELNNFAWEHTHYVQNIFLGLHFFLFFFLSETQPKCLFTLAALDQLN